MTVSDVTILGKKILVGIIVTLVPFIIIFGGLWLTRKLLSYNETTKQPIEKQIKTNKL
ncbi:hypothetical protein [Mucilaginibacter sp.]|uniref:hypothetical protein n=1 Tax=Mucilaginibacter sp. TaxID=1882438 RepID=UPI002616D550|nr:hypothetical protein [Mucilaginibacter sp.]MDB4921518.1 hypothetical protein [Mucilaginibacter sp.]